MFKNSVLRFFIFTATFLVFVHTDAQILSVTPENPSVDSTITLIYDATEGNGELAGFTGDVYMHTGVITIESSHPGDWKYVVTDWCENTQETLMTSLGNDLYQAEFHIRSFYGIPEDEIVLQLAFLFRSDDCSLVGRDADNGDIFFPLAVNYSTTSYESYELINDSLIVHCEDGDIIMTPYTDNIINVFSATQGSENEPSYSVIAEKEIINFDFSEDQNLLKFSTDSLEVVIDTLDLSFRFVYENDTVLHFIKIYNFEDQGFLVSELQENERIYGTGSRAIDADRRGRNLAVNNQAHYGYTSGTENLNITLPVFNSSESYSVLFDNHSTASLDIGAMNEDQLAYTYSSGQADVFIIAGNDHGSLVKSISFLTGYQPLPPLWSLGYIQSKYGYENEAAAYGIVNELLDADFPLDALVLDLFWFGDPGTMGNLDWDNSRFPNPEIMMADFSGLGVKTVLITEPYFTLASSNYAYADAQGYFGENASGETYVLNGFWAGDAALLDLFNPDVPAWFNQFYTDRTNEGVAGWWTDLGEPESHPGDMFHFGGLTSGEIHNVYALEWEKIVFENWRNEFPNRRLFNLSRSGFTGMQRYSTFPWSGDIQRSYEGLQVQVPIMLSMGLNGIPYMHSDVGGFTGGGNDDELFTRWVQMGVFAPVFRIHGSGIETAPTAYGSNARNITREYIKLRYQLLPYNYTLAYEASTKGLPFARPMDFHEIDNTNLQNINDQYFWGEEFIIAPVLYQGQTQREVILPEGKWLDYHTMQEYNGPGTFSFAAPLEILPILVKAGSFIPTVSGLYTTDEYAADTLFIQYFPDSDINEYEYTLYDDDKASSGSLENDEFCLITFSGACVNDDLTITLQSNGLSYPAMPETRHFIFEIFRVTGSPTSVIYNASDVIEYSTFEEMYETPLSYFVDSEKEKLFVHVPYEHLTDVLTVQDIQHTDVEQMKTQIADFSLYPNPASDHVIISGKDMKLKISKATVYDTKGKMVKSVNGQDRSKLRIDIGSLKKGVYIVYIHSDSKISLVKLVKQ